MFADIIVLLVLAINIFVLWFWLSFILPPTKKLDSQKEIQALRSKERIRYSNGKIVTMRDNCFHCRKEVVFSRVNSLQYIEKMYNKEFSLELQNVLACPECRSPALWLEERAKIDQSILLYLARNSKIEVLSQSNWVYFTRESMKISRQEFAYYLELDLNKSNSLEFETEKSMKLTFDLFAQIKTLLRYSLANNKSEVQVKVLSQS